MIDMGKLQDLTGQKFGRLTVIERDMGNKKRTKWLCKCDCGNDTSVEAYYLTHNITKSCGCLARETTSKNNTIDIIGQRFGRLTVIEMSERIKQKGCTRLKYKCKCDCGNEVYVFGENLRSGHTKSCGCYNPDVSKSKIEDITGNKYGRLIVIERAENQGEQTMWLCKCDCGNNTIVNGYHLKNGHIQSCGCVQSFGEYNVNMYLSNNNIKYIYQKKFDDLIGLKGKNLSYDFYIPNLNLLIECQGQQHYRPVDVYGGEEQFKVQLEHDRRKKEFAKNNNYKLLEIPYWEYDNIEEILNKELEVG